MNWRTWLLAGSGRAAPAYFETISITCRMVSTTSFFMFARVCICRGDAGAPPASPFCWVDKEVIKFLRTMICPSIRPVAYCFILENIYYISEKYFSDMKFTCSHWRQYESFRMLSPLIAAPIPPASRSRACHRPRAATSGCLLTVSFWKFDLLSPILIKYDRSKGVKSSSFERLYTYQKKAMHR